MSTKLNLGCGTNKIDGWINVDRAHNPDVMLDLEVFPWPWADSTVDEIRLVHVLEHLGQTPAVFIGVLKEMYRVCKHGANIWIVVPHPRHDDFLADPTHVRPVTERTLSLFSKSLNRKWALEGWSDSQLGLEHDIDFEIVNYVYGMEPSYYGIADEKMVRERNNIVKQINIELRVVK